MCDLNDLLKVQAKNAKEQRYLKCVDDGNNYWTIFRLMPRGRAVLRHVTDDEPLRQAQLLFLSGFGAGLLFSPSFGTTGVGLKLAAIHCTVLWHRFLQTSHGEIVLDGAAYPNTPTTLLNQALEIFIEGFCAGQHEARWRQLLRSTLPVLPKPQLRTESYPFLTSIVRLTDPFFSERNILCHVTTTNRPSPLDSSASSCLPCSLFAAFAWCRSGISGS